MDESGGLRSRFWSSSTDVRGNNAALNLLYALRPSAIQVTQGEVLTTAVTWRVTVFLCEDKRTIRKIEQEVEVGLIGCRYGADVTAFVEGRPPNPPGSGAIINPRGIKKLMEGLKDG